MSASTYVTRKEAAALCGVHSDTIRRDEKRGALPNVRERTDGTTEIPVADLVAAGRLDPVAARDGVEDIAVRHRAERDLVAARQELAVANARITGLTDELARQDAEITFLRKLLQKAVG
jgi:hypothetical protein